jgi:type II secretion system (T2SS) protein F
VISPAAVLAGLASGTGLALVIAELLPSRPDMRSVAAALEPSDSLGPAPTSEAEPLAQRVGARLLRVSADLVRVPAADLAVLGISRARHLGSQALWALGGLLAPQVLTVLLALGGAGGLVVLPLFASLLIAAALWVNADVDVRGRAGRRRGEARFVIASFLERAALERAADASAVDALQRAAAVGDSWVSERIRATLRGAVLSGITPWQALRQLAVDLDIPELARPADAFALAGEEGAAVYDALTAQAAALRDALRGQARAAAGEASTRMVLPVTCLVFLLMGLILYPAVTRIVAT